MADKTYTDGILLRKINLSTDIATQAELISVYNDLSSMISQTGSQLTNYYDKSEINTISGALNEAINTEKGRVDTLVGSDTGKSVRTIANEEAISAVTDVIAGADADFDTLKEIADWIKSDTTGAAKMANDIAALNTFTSVDLSNAITAEAQAREQADTALGQRIDALSVSLNAADGDAYVSAYVDGNTVKVVTQDNVKNAVDKVIATSASWDAAEQNAKNYADSLSVNYDAAGTAVSKANSLREAIQGVITDARLTGTIADDYQDIGDIIDDLLKVRNALKAIKELAAIA